MITKKEIKNAIVSSISVKECVDKIFKIIKNKREQMYDIGFKHGFDKATKIIQEKNDKL